ncbi:hypothetical protein NMY22_g7889 [Coprinellus aureogranulatus]|nr:hypothetical protein NMY22_g7889 [Coprinellus aureogranulatus]
MKSSIADHGEACLDCPRWRDVKCWQNVRLDAYDKATSFTRDNRAGHTEVLLSFSVDIRIYFSIRSTVASRTSSTCHHPPGINTSAPQRSLSSKPPSITQPEQQPTKPAMDSFTAISFTSDKAPTAVKIPTDAEDTGKGQTGGNYCVVFAKDIPIDEEDTGKGQTGGNYCTIA